MIKVYPKLPIASEICVYLNQKSEFGPLISKFLGHNIFVVSTSVKSHYFDASWIKEEFINK